MKKGKKQHTQKKENRGPSILDALGDIPKQDMLVFGFLLLVLIILTFSVPVHRWGDASTYYMQIRSIVNDHDIQYTVQDIQDITLHPFSDAPAGLFLIKTADGRYFYGKDFSYALFAAPFYALLNNKGILLFNGLMFFAMVAMGYLYVRKENGPYSTLYAVLFFVLSAYFVYVFWIHADIYNAFLLMLGLFLWLMYYDRQDDRLLIASSLALGLAVVAKAPNAVVFVPLAFYELYKKRYRNLLITCGAFLLPILLFTGFFFLQTGSLSYYGGDRYYYNGQYPFMGGYNATNEAGSHAFSVNSGDTLDIFFGLDNPVTIPYNLFYYFFGRFTGMLWYFPFAVFALLSFLWRIRDIKYARQHPEKLCIFAGIVLYILTFVLLLGNNYGGNALGNRYFYVYPALIFLLDTVDIKKAAIFLLIALFTVVPLIASPIAGSNSWASHTENFPYTYFPLEYSQIDQLPIIGASYDYQGHALMIYGDKPAYRNGAFIIGKSTKMTIRADAPLDQITLALTGNNRSTAIINVDGLTQDARINGSSYQTVIMDGIKPAYQDNRYAIYELSVNYKPA